MRPTYTGRTLPTKQVDNVLIFWTMCAPHHDDVVLPYIDCIRPLRTASPILFKLTVIGYL